MQVSRLFGLIRESPVVVLLSHLPLLHLPPIAFFFLIFLCTFPSPVRVSFLFAHAPARDTFPVEAKPRVPPCQKSVNFLAV